MITKDSKLIVIDGPGRSGTTLMSRTLNSHGQIFCVSEGLNEFSKSYLRYIYDKEFGRKVKKIYPIDNFFFRGNKVVRDFLLKANYWLEIPDKIKDELYKNVILRESQYFPNIGKNLKRFKSNTFAEVFLELLNYFHRELSDTEKEFYGFKVAWSEQLIIPLLNSFPNSFAFHLLRDPRGSIASNFASKNIRYPLFFNIRDWRKSVYYNWKISRQSNLKKRYFFLTYEKFVTNYKKSCERICNFLGLIFDKYMLNAQNQFPNTSYNDIKNKTGIVKSQISRWKEILPKDIILQINYFCYPEMKRMNFSVPNINEDKINFDFLFNLEQPNYNTLSEWCKVMVGSKDNYNNSWLIKNIYLEILRLKYFIDDIIENDLDFEECFYFEMDYYNWLKSF